MAQEAQTTENSEEVYPLSDIEFNAGTPPLAGPLKLLSGLRNLKIFQNIKNIFVGGRASGALSKLKIRSDVVLKGGRSGQNVKNLEGPPNAAVRGGGERAFITNEKGQVIFDVTRGRVKPVTPGKGFGPKRVPTKEELKLLDRVLKGGK